MSFKLDFHLNNPSNVKQALVVISEIQDSTFCSLEAKVGSIKLN